MAQCSTALDSPKKPISRDPHSRCKKQRSCCSPCAASGQCSKRGSLHVWFYFLAFKHTQFGYKNMHEMLSPEEYLIIAYFLADIYSLIDFYVSIITHLDSEMFNVMVGK